MVEKDEKKDEKKVWAVGAVPTETQPVIVNQETEEQLDLYSAVAELLNNQRKLMKLLD